MSKHKKHIPKSDSFLKRVFSSEHTKEAYTDLEWEAKQGLEQLGEDGVNEALANIHKRIESQKSRPSKKRNAIPLWRYAAAAACAGILIVIGNQIIDSVNNQVPTSYETTAPAPNNDSDKETERKEEVDTALTDDKEPQARSYNNNRLPPPPLAEQALKMELPNREVPEETAMLEEEVVEEIASEEIVVYGPAINIGDNSSSQGSEVIEQEENPPVAYMEDEMNTNNVMADQVAPAMAYRISEKNSLSTEGMADSNPQESVYDWSSAFAEKQFEEITKRFEDAKKAEESLSEEAMFYAARAYYALDYLDEAKAIMQEVVDFSGDKVGEAQGFLEEWEE